MLSMQLRPHFCKIISSCVARSASTKVAVVGAPISKGQPRQGVENGPQSLRDTGIVEKLRSQGLDVLDAGDVVPKWHPDNKLGPFGEKDFSNVLKYNKMLSDRLSGLRKEGHLCVTLGGDHSIGIGTVTGHSEGLPDKQILLLWVDAHADINTGKSSPTKNIHGMSTSYLIKNLEAQTSKLPGTQWPRPCLTPNHIVYIGLRDVDYAERGIIQELGMKTFTMRDVDTLGINEVIARSFDFLNPSSNNSLHVSFDIDSLDPLYAPSTGTPVPGGLNIREGLQIVEAAHDTGYLGGFDLVEVNPSLGSEADVEGTKNSAVAIILGAIAGVRGTCTDFTH